MISSNTRGIQLWSKSYIGSSWQVIDVNINHLSLFDGMLVKRGCIYFLISTDQAFKASAPWMVTTCLKNWPFLGQKMLFWGQIYHFPLRSCLSAPYLQKNKKLAIFRAKDALLGSNLSLSSQIMPSGLCISHWMTRGQTVFGHFSARNAF